MAKYFIYEGNLDRLKTHMTRIENKCAKYNLHFHFEVVGSEYRDVKQEDGTTITCRFIEVEVEGLMKHENWEFIAKIDHHTQGNIIRQFKTDIEVPEKYRYTDSVCEHCNSNRRRKFTYLVHNTETDDWKQVGSSCLKEFTMGLDAEAVARYISFFDEVIKGETSLFSGVHYVSFYKLAEFLSHAKETVDRFGYVSRATADEEYKTSTRDRAWAYYRHFGFGDTSRVYEKEINEAIDIGYNADRDDIAEYVKNAIDWVRNLAEDDMKGNSYLFNLHIACMDDYFDSSNAGFIVSLIPTYYRHLSKLEYEAKKKREAEMNPSRHQGEIGKRIEFKPASITCVSCNDSLYGVSYLYRILDEAGNVYMWSTGNFVDCNETFQSVRGTVKSHDEFRGIQQTFLTRCKIA